jgi:Zn-dependent protease with chaperone function
MKLFQYIVTLFFTTGLAWGQPVPAAQFAWPQSPKTIRLISIVAPASWRDGRPIVPREAVAKILKLSTEGSADVDLIEELTRQNWVVQSEHDGSIVARPALAAVSTQTGFAAVRETAESRLAVANFRKICAKENTPWIEDSRQAQLDRVGQALAAQARRPIPWTFAIVRSNKPNAACTGEGMVYITTALLDMLDEDELAGVLGHEVAHGSRQHLAENRNENQRVQKTVDDFDKRKADYEREVEGIQAQYDHDVANGANEGMARATRDSRMESANGRYRFSLGNIKDRLDKHDNYDSFKGKTDERQADLAGMRLATGAGYRADGLLRALEKLQAANFHRYGEAAMLGSSTHPPIGERIKAQREILSRMK